jgi:hypothetical protein
MRGLRQLLLSAATSAGVLVVVAGLVLAVRRTFAGDTVDDDVEVPLELVGAILVFVVLVPVFATLREASLRRVAFISIGFGLAVAAWLVLTGQAHA